jgi:hypothetical protein
MRLMLAAALIAAGAIGAHAGETIIGPWTGTPLTFGMTPDEAAQALGVPLNHVGGRPGNELFVALPNVKGSALSNRSDGLFLQFHRGRLEGWKGDWGTIR